MTLQAALGRIPNLSRRIAGLLVGVVLSALSSHLSAQTPSFKFATAQILPATQSSQFTFGSVAVDQAGNIFLANTRLGTIQELPAGSTQLAPVAVTGVTNPLGIAVDGAGNLYIADDSVGPGGQALASIIKLTPSGAQSKVGSGWITPVAIAADLAGDIFVVEAEDQYTINSAVYEVAVNSNTRIKLNFKGLNSPQGIAVDPAGNVYVADYKLGSILKLAVGSNTQTTLTTGIDSAWGIATDLAGNLFYDNGSAIDEIPAGSATPIPAYSWQNSPVDAGPYIAPYVEGIAVDIHGSLIFTAVNGGNTNYFVAEAQRASVDFGSTQICVPGWTSASECSVKKTLWLNAGANTPMVQFLSGGVVNPDFVASFAMNACTSLSLSAGYGCPVDVTFSPRNSGSRSAMMQLLDTNGRVQSSTPVYGLGVGPQVVFGSASQSTVGTGQSIKAIAVDDAGNVFAASQLTRTVLEFPAGGGAAKSIGTGLHHPTGVAVDAAGNVFISDSDGNQVVKVAPSGTQTTVGKNITNPQGVALDNVGNVYIADQGNGRVVKVLPLGGYQTLVAGGNWNLPVAVAVDSEGNIYAIDGPGTNAPQVRKLTISTGVSTVLGSGFLKPCGLAVDAAGNVYVGDSDINAVVEIPVSGEPQVNLGTGIVNPCGVALDAKGNIFVADYGNSRILKLTRTQAPSLSFASTQVGATSSDSPKSVQIANVGNGPLVAAGGLTNGTNFSQVAYSGTDTDCTEVFWLEPGMNCALSFSFTPTLAGPLTSSDLLATNANPDFALIPLQGTGTDVATNLTNVGGSGQSAAYGSAFATRLSVLVQNASGAGVASAAVTFTGVGVKFASTTVLTNASGYASVLASAARVGSLTATARVAGVNTPATFTETGTKANLRVTPTSFAWDLNQAFTLSQYSISGLVNGDTVSGTPVLTTTAHKGSPIGGYLISASKGTLVAPASYTIVYGTGELIIDSPSSIGTWEGVGQSSAKGTPFTTPLGIYVVGTLGRYLGGVPITFASAHMTFSSNTATTLGAGTATVIATPTAIGSMTATATITGTALSATFSETGTVPSPAAIVVSSGSAQTAIYSFKFAQPFKVLVTDKFGSPSKNATVTFSGTGIKLTSTTATTGSDGTAIVSGYPTSVGSLTVSASVTGVSTVATFHETGTRAPLTVTANNATSAFLFPLPTLTYTITGFVNGDNIAVVSGAPAETTPATNLSAPGTYPINITQGTLSSSNYAFTKFVNGTLTIRAF